VSNRKPCCVSEISHCESGTPIDGLIAVERQPRLAYRDRCSTVSTFSAVAMALPLRRRNPIGGKQRLQPLTVVDLPQNFRRRTFVGMTLVRVDDIVAFHGNLFQEQIRDLFEVIQDFGGRVRAPSKASCLLSPGTVNAQYGRRAMIVGHSRQTDAKSEVKSPRPTELKWFFLPRWSPSR
jgi:hypothetical protein